MTQTYISRAAVHWMREGLCPECGNKPETHGSDNRFWLPRPHFCALTERGVVNRIARQREIDETLEDT